MSNTLPGNPAGSASASRAALFAARLARLRGLHGDERGTISIVTVVALMMFTLTMGMVINVGRQVDSKVKQQNAADAASYSGGVILTRGMNSLAFSNHLLCDVFALTAFMREARDRNAEKLAYEVLDVWDGVGPIFDKSPYEKFKGLGQGVSEKTRAEREMIRTFSEFVAAISEQTLPTLEQILAGHLIPKFEADVVQRAPVLAQQTTAEIARRHGMKPASDLNTRGLMWGVLWRTNVEPTGFAEQDPQRRTLPAIDPALTGIDYNNVPYGDIYLQTAFNERFDLSRTYLQQWNSHVLGLMQKYAKLSQFYNLWRIFTHGQLCKLQYEEYPTSNLPFQIRRLSNGMVPEDVKARRVDGQVGPADLLIRQYLEQNNRFVGVCYRKPMQEMFGKLFLNKLQADSLTFSEVAIFLPKPRLYHIVAAGGPAPPAGASNGGNLFGPPLPQDPEAQPRQNPPVDTYGPENWPTEWSLLSQNWTIQLVPATARNVASILQMPPQQFSNAVNIDQSIKVPDLGGIQPEEFRKLNHH